MVFRNGQLMTKVRSKIKIVAMIALLGFITTIPGMATASQSQFKDSPEITVAVNGELVSFPDQPPVVDTQNCRTLVPVRFPAETLGADVDWHQATQEVTIDQMASEYLPEAHLVLKLGSPLLMVNGKQERMDTIPIVKNQRTLVPIRFISEYLGAEVKWWQDSKTVHVFTKGQSEEEQQKIIDEVAEQLKPQPPVPKPSGKIPGTPFYQATPEQIQQCKNAPLPVYASDKVFDKMSVSGREAAYDMWSYRFNRLPYDFITDKTLVYMSGMGGTYFRGYMDLKDGAGTRMVDVIFGDSQATIINVYDRSQSQWISW